MSKSIMAICDSEESYLYRFLDYINARSGIPFQVTGFSKTEALQSFCKTNKVAILVIAESDYTPEIKKLFLGQLVILSEQGNAQYEDALSIRKYQSSEAIIKQIQSAAFSGDESFLQRGSPAKLLGVYTPIGRCLQTSFALLLGQLLAEQKSILYLNFEPFSGFGRFIKSESAADLTDLMYFLNHLEDNFLAKFKTMVESVNGLDYIPPAFSFVDLSSIEAEGWIALLERILESCNYSYIILDLSDSIRGLTEILAMCERIYTITAEDGIAMAKINQYEQLLAKMENAEILQKTKKFRFPQFKQIPMEIEQLPYCELAKYVKALIKEDIV